MQGESDNWLHFDKIVEGQCRYNGREVPDWRFICFRDHESENDSPCPWSRNALTQTDHLLACCTSGTFRTNVHLRKPHNYCRSIHWLPLRSLHSFEEFS